MTAPYVTPIAAPIPNPTPVPSSVVAPIVCIVAKDEPATTLPIPDCIVAASEPAATPELVNPINHGTDVAAAAAEVLLTKIIQIVVWERKVDVILCTSMVESLYCV